MKIAAMPRRGTHAVNMVLTFVLVAIVLIVVVALFTTLRGLWDSTTEDSECRTQIRAHSAAVRYTADQNAPTIVCPTKRLTAPPEEAKQAIASEMARCWDMWGRGRLPLFGAKVEGAYCHVCSTITLSEDVAGMPEYLDTAKTREGVTFAQFLAGTTEGEYFIHAERPGQGADVLTSDVPLGVIFIHAKGQGFFERTQNFIVGSTASAPYRGMAIGFVLALAGPGGWVTGAFLVAGGGVVNTLASLTAREPLDSLSLVVVRPLAPGDIAQLGCTYAPVAAS